MENTKVEALHVMIAAQGLLIEQLWAIVLSERSQENEDAIKDLLVRTAGNSVAAYTGGPADVEQIQAWGELVQGYTRELVDGIGYRARLFREHRNPHP